MSDFDYDAIVSDLDGAYFLSCENKMPVMSEDSVQWTEKGYLSTGMVRYLMQRKIFIWQYETNAHFRQQYPYFLDEDQIKVMAERLKQKAIVIMNKKNMDVVVEFVFQKTEISERTMFEGSAQKTRGKEHPYYDIYVSFIWKEFTKEKKAEVIQSKFYPHGCDRMSCRG